MVGKSTMKLYEAFENAYASRLSRLARSELVLELAGRYSDLLGLVKSLSDARAEQLLELLRLPTVGQLTDALRAQRELEMENRRLRRTIEALSDRIDRLEATPRRPSKGK